MKYYYLLRILLLGGGTAIYDFLKLRGEWFLIVLLIVSICIWVLLRTNKRIYVIDIIVIIMYVGGLTFSSLKPPLNEYCITSSVALGFFWVGYRLNKQFLTNAAKVFDRRLLCIIGIMLIVLVYAIPSTNVLMYKNEYGDAIVFTIKALLGIVAVLSISISVKHNKVIEYLGNNSLTILLIHFPIYKTLYYVGTKVFVDNMLQLYSILCFMITAMVASGVSCVINQIIPEFGGKRRR